LITTLVYQSFEVLFRLMEAVEEGVSLKRF
jgi:hypothetical protein